MWGLQGTHRPLSSAFLWLIFRILQGNPKKELLRGLWVEGRGCRACCRFVADPCSHSPLAEKSIPNAPSLVQPSGIARIVSRRSLCLYACSASQVSYRDGRSKRPGLIHPMPRNTQTHKTYPQGPEKSRNEKPKTGTEL